jgi:hypothetical protein
MQSNFLKPLISVSLIVDMMKYVPTFLASAGMLVEYRVKRIKPTMRANAPADICRREFTCSSPSAYILILSPSIYPNPENG